MSNKYEQVPRYSIWDGHKTHTDHYCDGQKVGELVERYSAWDGEYTKTDYYNTSSSSSK